MPRRDDVHGRTAAQHEADAGITEAFEIPNSMGGNPCS